jgi:hypothetical protein
MDESLLAENLGLDSSIQSASRNQFSGHFIDTLNKPHQFRTNPKEIHIERWRDDGDNE